MNRLRKKRHKYHQSMVGIQAAGDKTLNCDRFNYQQAPAASSLPRHTPRSRPVSFDMPAAILRTARTARYAGKRDNHAEIRRASRRRNADKRTVPVAVAG